MSQSLNYQNKHFQFGSFESHPTCLFLRSMLDRIKEPFIIGISGDSGSGKTVFSDGIRRLLGESVVKTIEMDGYHKENRAERLKTGHLPLDPSINKLDLLHQHLTDLKKGKAIEIPVYNHATGDFDNPRPFAPAPIIIIEGLHALYPEFLPLLDLSIYVDPSREVKWKWKYRRDMEKRGHAAEKLIEEMLKREAAYKRWIDFQKTSANIVIKVNLTQMANYARYELVYAMPEMSYKVELIIQPSQKPLPSLMLPLNMGSILDNNQPPFLLAAVPSLYWGRKVMDVTIDGLLPEQTIASLENFIVSCTGIPIKEAMKGDLLDPKESNENVSATKFAQLIIAWRFLEQVNWKYNELGKQ
ncbi:phosphoribulokinase [Patescibacteria group bacterium]|nr:phosphoribulokinase [Patescibacteria group bacterium]MCL5798118.1 phosphoribulokinase [Patescibacteria group bacterium]